MIHEADTGTNKGKIELMERENQNRLEEEGIMEKERREDLENKK